MLKEDLADGKIKLVFSGNLRKPGESNIVAADEAVASSAVRPTDGRTWPKAADGDWPLVQQVRQGDVRAFSVLVEKYQDRLFNSTLRLCGNYSDACELTQEAFLRALRGITGFRGEAKFYTWLFRIALNLIRSHQRRAGRKHFSSLDGPNGKLEIASQAAGLLGRDCADPAQQALEAERNLKVAAALGRLAEQYRTVVVLRDVEGLDYQEIAQTLDVPVGTVKSRVHRGRLALRGYLADLMK